MANHRSKGSRSKNLGYQAIEPTRVPRSAFDLSYAHKTTAEPSKLMPLYHQEVMPGDTISWRPSFLARMTSNVFPYLDGIVLEYQAFFVPCRILWVNWAKMHGERVDPADHIDYTVPQVTSPVGGWLENSYSDYLGIPTQIDGLTVSALYHRAGANIWNEWFRDQNLQDSIPIPLDDGPDDPTDPHCTLQVRGKRKDRFAGALPFAQKGDPVTLPIGGNAPVVPHPTDFPSFNTATDAGARLMLSAAPSGDSFSPAWTANVPMKFILSGLEADLAGATQATIQEMRTAISLQHLFERDARGGNRYAEGIMSHFGVHMPDVRYRPELLCVGSVEVTPQEVPQQSATEVGLTPQGTLAAFARGAGVGPGFHKSLI